MRFVVIASPRTGSSHLTTQLVRAKEIWCHDEVFHQREVFLRWPKGSAPEDLTIELRALRATDPEGFLERIYALSFERPHVGFRIFEHHHPSMLAKLIADHEIAKIVLVRTNVLANYASELVARETGVYGKRLTSAPLVHFDPEEFLAHHTRYIDFYARTVAQLNASGQLFELVRYDELNNPQLVAKLVRFLGGASTPGISSAPEHVRGSSNILSRFSNPGDAREFLRVHHRLEWEHEGENSFAPLTEDT